MTSVIEFNNISRSYRKGVPVLDGVTFSSDKAVNLRNALRQICSYYAHSSAEQNSNLKKSGIEPHKASDKYAAGKASRRKE